MPNKDLKDKMKNIGNTSKEYDEKVNKEKKKKTTIITIVVILILAIFGTFLYKSKITNDKSSNSPDTKISNNKSENKQSEDDLEIDDNLTIQDNDNTADIQLSNNSSKPEVLNKNFKDTIKSDKKELIDTGEEYKAINKEVTEERNKFYENNVALDIITQGTEPSEADGFTDDVNKRMDKDLISDNYVPITAERLETVISHELEKIVNPKYRGEEGESNGVITSVYIEKDNLVEGSEMFAPKYHVFYTISYPKDGSYSQDPEDGEMVFTVNEKGEIEWISKD